MAEISYAVQLWVGANEAATTASVQISGIKSVTPPSLSADKVDVTHQDSQDMLREYIPGMLDQGEISLELGWTPGMAAEEVIRTMMIGREIRYMEIRFTGLATAVKYGGRAFFMGFEPSPGAVGDEMTASATACATTLWEEVA